ncbi:MAG TPA: hypothetical protein VJX70_05875 [Candidatus Acidoferrum sp.]|nr:hypothetical protein [Candidatus Acidoferrum sp.]
MSISSIVQITERLFSGNIGKNPEDQGKNQAAPATTQGQANRTEFGDRFTPSEQADPANAAASTGVFQLERLRFTALNLQKGGGNAATTNAAAPTAATAAPDNTALNVAAVPVAAAAAAPAAAVVPAPVTAAAQPATANTTASASQTQQDLQTLNSTLTALGLNAAEIAAFDQFAGILLQFNPNALQQLESQLNLLAAQYQTQNAPAPAAAAAAAPTAATTAPAAAPATPATAAPTPVTAAPAAAAVTPGFQLTELAISFKGVNETVTQGGQNGGNSTTTQISAFSLQVQEVRVSLTNPAGQTTQLQVPQATGTTATAPAAAAAAKAATS